MARTKTDTPQAGNRWRNRIVGEGDEAPDQLLANPLNFRVHTTDQGQALAGAIGTLGWIQRVVVNKRTGHVIDGHLRVRQAMQRGEATVTVVYVDLDEREERIALATLDPIAAMAKTDDALLVELLEGLDVEDAALAEFLADLNPDQETESGDGGGGEGDGPVMPAIPTTKPGELIELGAHRLFCGDSTNAAHVAQLMQDDTAAVVFTDPPYAIFGSSTGVGNDVADDKMVRPFFRDVLRMAKAHLKTFGHLYVCCDWRSWSAWWSVAAEVELVVKNMIVWDKGGGLGSMYANGHELMVFASNVPKLRSVTSKKKQTGERMVNDTNVWRIGRATEAERDTGATRHNAQKPLALVARAIENSTETGEIVLDLFGGSGTTMLACENAGRACRMMEMEPSWCDAIITRWETATGLEAVRHPPGG